MDRKNSFDLRDHVFKVENFLDKEFCKHLIKKLNKHNWVKHAYYDSKTRTKTQNDNELSVIVPDIPERKLMEEKLEYALMDYFTKMNYYGFTTLTKFSGIRYNRYEVGTEMRLHVDHIHSLFDGKDQGVPVLTMLGSLNENYQGGEFCMFNDIEYKMPTGTLLIFPSCFLFPHCVKVVTKGIRYSYVSWGW